MDKMGQAHQCLLSPTVPTSYGSTFPSSPYVTNPGMESPIDDITAISRGPPSLQVTPSGTKLSGHQLLGTFQIQIAMLLNKIPRSLSVVFCLLRQKLQQRIGGRLSESKPDAASVCQNEV